MKSKKIVIAHQDDASVKFLSAFLHDLGYGIEKPVRWEESFGGFETIRSMSSSSMMKLRG